MQQESKICIQKEIQIFKLEEKYGKYLTCNTSKLMKRNVPMTVLLQLSPLGGQAHALNTPTTSIS